MSNPAKSHQNKLMNKMAIPRYTCLPTKLLIGWAGHPIHGNVFCKWIVCYSGFIGFKIIQNSMSSMIVRMSRNHLGESLRWKYPIPLVSQFDNVVFVCFFVRKWATIYSQMSIIDKVDDTYAIIFLIRTHIFEWYVASRMNRRKNVCWKRLNCMLKIW